MLWLPEQHMKSNHHTGLIYNKAILDYMYIEGPVIRNVLFVLCILLSPVLLSLVLDPSIVLNCPLPICAPTLLMRWNAEHTDLIVSG